MKHPVPAADANPWRVTWFGSRTEWRWFALAVFGSTAYGILTVLTATVLGHLVQDVAAPAVTERRFTLGMAAQVGWQLGGIVLLNVIAVILRRIAAGITYNNLIAMSRLQLTRAYQKLPLTWHARRPAGQLLSGANSDTEQTWSIFQPLPMALGVAVMLAFGFISIFLVDTLLGFVALVIFPALVVINYWFQTVMRARVEAAQSARAHVSAIADESFDGAVVVKALGRRDAEVERFASGADDLRNANIRVGRAAGVFDPVTNALPTLGTLLVVLVGAHRVASGHLQPGDVVQVAYLFNLLSFPVRSFGWILFALPAVTIGWSRTKPILDEADALHLPPTSPALPSGPLPVTLRDVSFGYEPGREIVHDITLDIAAGEKVALVGATGSGKSTVANILAGVVTPTTGSVQVAGHDLAGALNRPQRVVLATQEAFVFNESASENIALGRAEVDEEHVHDALRTAHADGFVSQLPAGVDEPLGEGGNRLSGGQRQRIALARALAGRPGLLVLDDATSAIDPSVEGHILTDLAAVTGGSTTVIIAHRKSSITLADRVIFLQDGRITATGTHEHLMRTNPAYATLLTAYDHNEANDSSASASDDDAPHSPRTPQTPDEEGQR